MVTVDVMFEDYLFHGNLLNGNSRSGSPILMLLLLFDLIQYLIKMLVLRLNKYARIILRIWVEKSSDKLFYLLLKHEVLSRIPWARKVPLKVYKVEGSCSKRCKNINRSKECAYWGEYGVCKRKLEQKLKLSIFHRLSIDYVENLAQRSWVTSE